MSQTRTQLVGGVGISTADDLNLFGDLNVTGVVTATQFVGDGSGLTAVVGSGSGIIIQDESSPIGTAGTINFVGAAVSSSLSLGIATVTVSDAYAQTAGVATVAQGLTGSPNITVGVATATSFSGSGAGITSIDAGNISAGIVTSARLGSGTAADNTFLNGHGQFITPVSGSLEYISSVTISGNASYLTFTSGITTAYSTYVFMGRNLRPTQTGTRLEVQYYDTSWTQGTSPYGAALLGQGGGNQYNGDVSVGAGDDFGMTHQSLPIGNSVSRGVEFIYYVFDPTNTSANYTYAQGHTSYSTGSQEVAFATYSHAFGLTSAISQIRFKFSGSSTMSSGTVDMYGIKNS